MHAGADTCTSTCPLELARDRLSVLSAAACMHYCCCLLILSHFVISRPSICIHDSCMVFIICNYIVVAFEHTCVHAWGCTTMSMLQSIVPQSMRAFMIHVLITFDTFSQFQIGQTIEGEKGGFLVDSSWCGTCLQLLPSTS